MENGFSLRLGTHVITLVSAIRAHAKQHFLKSIHSKKWGLKPPPRAHLLGALAVLVVVSAAAHHTIFLSVLHVILVLLISPLSSLFASFH